MVGLRNVGISYEVVIIFIYSGIRVIGGDQVLDSFCCKQTRQLCREALVAPVLTKYRVSGV